MTKNPNRFFFLFPILALVFLGNQPVYGQDLPSIAISLENPSDFVREEVFISLPAKQLYAKASNFNSEGFTVYVDSKEIPAQYVDQGPDEGLVFVLPQLASRQQCRVSVTFDPDNEISHTYPKKTQAELSHKINGHFDNRKYIGGEFQNVSELHVPAEHTDHSWFIRYEGPGWESDKVGYRFYLDWRNGVDVFGKTVTEPILQLVGQDGFDSYHEMQDWGMDVLKVGKSLGVGSIATFQDNKARRVDETDSLYAKVLENGVVYSSILTKYHGWNLPAGKTDITSQLSIHQGSRLSKQLLQSSNALENFATGLIKDPKGSLIKSDSNNRYGYLATYGKQSLNDDNLGIGIIYLNSDLIEITEDEFSHIVVLDSKRKEASYYFLAAWELERDGITNLTAFTEFMDQKVQELSNPIVVTFE